PVKLCNHWDLSDTTPSVTCRFAELTTIRPENARMLTRFLRTICFLLACSLNGLATGAPEHVRFAGAFIEKPAFPLKVSSNHRYLVDQHGEPFLVTGDSPQSLIGNLSEDEATSYVANRASYGI